ncbi:MAG: hypothetical protein LUD27_04230 [Clostridia bacterium]|nr:hypothetical protein [Clostridia bacterium]
MGDSGGKKSHGFLKFIVVVLVMFAVVLIGAKLIDYGTSTTNTDGNSKLLSRSARNSDVEISYELALSSLGVKFTVMPQVDISGLEITVNILDENKKNLSTIEKTIGNVKEGVQANFTVSLVDLGLSVALKTEYASWSVTGGTVSYLA